MSLSRSIMLNIVLVLSIKIFKFMIILFCKKFLVGNICNGTIVTARDYDIRDSVDYLLYFLLGRSSYPTTISSVVGAL